MPPGDRSNQASPPAFAAAQVPGACCTRSTRTCVDNVDSSTCVGADKLFSPGPCCEVECRATSPTYDALDMELLSHIPVATFPGVSTFANDCWGYTSPRGRRYAIIGLDETTAFVDITEPRSPFIVDDIPDSSSFWSDIKVYRQYAYNGNETGGGIQVFDMTQIDPPTRVVTLLGTFTETGIETTHTIALNEESGFMYLNGAGDLLGPRNFIAVDLADPANPTFAGEWLGPQATSTHDSQVVTYHSGPYAGREIAFLYAGDAFKTLDVTDKSNMVLLGILPDADSPYPTLGYNHQGWLTEDRKYVLFNDEFDEFISVPRTTTYVVDVQDLLDPTIVATFAHPTGCWIDHDEHVKGQRVYQAQYTAGVRVLDITDPLNPSEVAYFDTHPENNVQDFQGVWGIFPFFPMRVVIASDIERGLFVLCDQRSKPLAGFTVNANPVACDTTVAFDASSSTHCAAAGSISAYEWDFDYDGLTFDSNAVGVSTTHRYSSPCGVFRAALRVTDGLGAQDIMTLNITAESPIPTISQWGAVAMFASLLAIGSVVLLRRHRIRAWDTRQRRSRHAGTPWCECVRRTPARRDSSARPPPPALDTPCSRISGNRWEASPAEGRGGESRTGEGNESLLPPLVRRWLALDMACQGLGKPAEERRIF